MLKPCIFPSTAYFRIGPWLTLRRQALGHWNILPDTSAFAYLKSWVTQNQFDQIVYANNVIYGDAYFCFGMLEPEWLSSVAYMAKPQEKLRKPRHSPSRWQHCMCRHTALLRELGTSI